MSKTREAKERQRLKRKHKHKVIRKNPENFLVPQPPPEAFSAGEGFPKVEDVDLIPPKELG